MMTPDALKKRVLQEFDSASVLESVELNESLFVELPRLFEVSHLSMQIVLNDQTVMATVSQIAAKLKRDLHQQGVELEYTLAAQWKVLCFSSDTLECVQDGRWMPRESFHVELQSGRATRLVMVRLSLEAMQEILRYLTGIPIHVQQGDIYKILEACLHRQLAATEPGHWDPVLYPSRTIQKGDIVAFLLGCEESKGEAPRLEKLVVS